MIYMQNDLFSNVTGDSVKDPVMQSDLVSDEIASLIAYDRDDLIELMVHSGINVPNNPSSKDMSKLVMANIESNKVFTIGLALLIAEKNGLTYASNGYSNMFGRRNATPSAGKIARMEKKALKAAKPTRDKNAFWTNIKAGVGRNKKAIGQVSDNLVKAKANASEYESKTGISAEDSIAKKANSKSPEDNGSRSMKIGAGIVIGAIALIGTIILLKKKGVLK